MFGHLQYQHQHEVARRGENTHDCVVPLLREEVKADAFLDSTSSTPTLSCVGLGDERLDEATDLPLLVEPHLAMLSGIDDACKTRVSQRPTTETSLTYR